MNEVQALIEAFDAACARGERCALATVVSVEGSSYRRPGARMLICEGGTSTGTISAGCLESDVIEHAKRVIRTGAAKLVEYNTATTGDEMPWGLGLGCNGVVGVLVEPLESGSIYVEALRHSCKANAAPLLVATVYKHTLTATDVVQNFMEPHSLAGAAACEAGDSIKPGAEAPGINLAKRFQPAERAAALTPVIETGARVLIDEDGNIRCENLSDRVAALLESEVRAVSQGRTGGAASCYVDGSAITLFVETLLPPVSLVIFGAGHDALPIVELARGLGWRTEVVDPQSRASTITQFAVADKVTLSRPDEVEVQVTITPRTLTLLMSHNFTYDLSLLKFLLASPACYIGVMGPRQRTERMLSELAANETTRIEHTDLLRIHSPAGLDLGANSPAEIALSIVAEMRAVLDGRHGGMLRERRGSIHGSPMDIKAAPVAETRTLTVAVA